MLPHISLERNGCQGCVVKCFCYIYSLQLLTKDKFGRKANKRWQILWIQSFVCPVYSNIAAPLPFTGYQQPGNVLNNIFFILPFCLGLGHLASNSLKSVGDEPVFLLAYYRIFLHAHCERWVLSSQYSNRLHNIQYPAFCNVDSSLFLGH